MFPETSETICLRRQYVSGEKTSHFTYNMSRDTYSISPETYDMSPKNHFLMSPVGAKAPT